MFQRKIDEIFKELANVYGIADDISILDYNAADGAEHYRMLYRVLEIY